MSNKLKTAILATLLFGVLITAAMHTKVAGVLSAGVLVGFLCVYIAAGIIRWNS